MNRRESPSVFGSRPSLSLPTLRTGTNFEFLVCLATFFHTVDIIHTRDMPHCWRHRWWSFHVHALLRHQSDALVLRLIEDEDSAPMDPGRASDSSRTLSLPILTLFKFALLLFRSTMSAENS